MAQPDNNAENLEPYLEPYLGVSKSVTGRTWLDRTKSYANNDATLRRVTQALGLKNLVVDEHIDPIARAIVGRGIGIEQLDNYLNPTLKATFPDPNSFMDMSVLVEAILDAFEANKNVFVFADYDVDGATSAAQLVRWFRHMGADLRVYVPDRITEGYGPSNAAFETMKSQGADLVITVDCGAMAHNAIEYATKIGLDVVVIDHHLMREDPPKCKAVVNPNRPGCQSNQGNLAAAGVVFVVLAALNREAEIRGLFKQHTKPDIRQWLDLAALGAICDVTSLTGFNRALTAQGLKVMTRQENIGIKALMKVSGLEPKDGEKALNVFHSGFVIGPRINAGGRVGKSDLGVRILATQNEEEAQSLALELDELNTKRRDVEAQVLQQAIDMMEGQGGIDEKNQVIIVASEGWHAGVIGIVAGRLRERWRKPVIVIGIDPISGLGKGSGRSQAGVNLGAAIGAAFESGLILSGGGHAMAAGLSLNQDQIIPLQTFINQHVLDNSNEAQRTENIEIDASLSSTSAQRTLLDGFDILAPFGPGNPEPIFAFSHMRIGFTAIVKGAHIRCQLSDDNGHQIKAMAWRSVDTPIGEALLKTTGLVHIVGRLKRDDYMGRRGVQLEIEDIFILSKKN